AWAAAEPAAPRSPIEPIVRWTTLKSAAPPAAPWTASEPGAAPESGGFGLSVCDRRRHEHLVAPHDGRRPALDRRVDLPKAIRTRSRLGRELRLGCDPGPVRPPELRPLAGVTHCGWRRHTKDESEEVCDTHHDLPFLQFLDRRAGNDDRASRRGGDG